MPLLDRTGCASTHIQVTEPSSELQTTHLWWTGAASRIHSGESVLFAAQWKRFLTFFLHKLELLLDDCLFVCVCLIKAARCSSEEDILIKRDVFTDSFLCLNRLNNQTLCFNDWINKLTLKDDAPSHCFTLFICGGPHHRSSFRQRSPVFSSEHCWFVQSFWLCANASFICWYGE